MGRRGGNRPPQDGRQRVPGAGANSERTDQLPIVAPDMDNPDLGYGDVQRLQEGMRQVPIRRGAQPQQGQPQGAPARALAPSMGTVRGNAGLPSYLFDRESDMPNQPTTEGMADGPGAGPEALPPLPYQNQERAELLQFLVDEFDNEDARQELLLMQSRDARPEPAAAPLTEPSLEEEEIEPGDTLIGYDEEDDEFEDFGEPQPSPDDDVEELPEVEGEPGVVEPTAEEELEEGAIEEEETGEAGEVPPEGESEGVAEDVPPEEV